MGILVDNKPIEVRLRYVDKPYPGGATGTLVFHNDKEEEDWVERENRRRSEKAMELDALKQEVPPNLKKDAKEEVKELVTFWKRIDWGTQNEISDQCVTVDSLGESHVNHSKYRSMQMQKLMVGWNLKQADGNPIKITPEILSKLDFGVAVALMNKYDRAIYSSEEDLENLE